MIICYFVYKKIRKQNYSFTKIENKNPILAKTMKGKVRLIELKYNQSTIKD